MIQPKWDDDAATWRRFAGALRERMGEANRRAVAAEARARDAEHRAVEAEKYTSPSLRARAEEAEAKLAGVWERSERHRGRFDELLKRKYRDGRLLDRLEQLLHDGDVPEAVDLLAERRAAIEAAKDEHGD